MILFFPLFFLLFLSTHSLQNLFFLFGMSCLFTLLTWLHSHPLIWIVSSAEGMHRRAPLFVNRLSCLSAEEQPGAVTFADVTRCCAVEDVWHEVVLSNYMIDLEWVFSQSPDICRAASITILVGGILKEEEAAFAPAIQTRGIAKKVKIICCPLPLPYGTHHAKVCLLMNSKGIRVIIGTANLIAADWERKNQGIFVQDFPAIASVSSSLVMEASGGQQFRKELVRFYANCGLDLREALGRYCFSRAAADIVASLPGYHHHHHIGVGAENSLGLHKLKQILRDVAARDTEDCGGGRPPAFNRLTLQYSSQGVLNDKFISDIMDSMALRQRPTECLFVVPTEQEVRCSVEGWRSGFSIPIHLKSMHEYVNARLHAWSPRPKPTVAEKEEGQEKAASQETGRSSLRSRAMPHIKTYCQHNGVEALWLCLTSANLSRAAWGESQKSGEQLQIRSYEMGVVFSAASLARYCGGGGEDDFCCTAAPSLASRLPKDAATVAAAGLHAVPISLGGDRRLVVDVLLPYNPLAPVPYASNEHLRRRTPGPPPLRDKPWVVDIPHDGVDALGRTFPEAAKGFTHYGADAWHARCLVFHREALPLRAVIDVDHEEEAEEPPQKRLRVEIL
jgi:tyrosyl-DNA phosphodiesterase-1